MKLYTVDPANTSIIAGPYFAGSVDRPGDRVMLPDGRIITAQGPVPAWGLYEAIEDSTATPAYNTRGPDTLTFTGDLFSPDARVLETRTFNQIPIDELYQIKQNEIGVKDNEARFQTARTALNANWWIVVREGARADINMMGTALAAGTPFPTNASKHPWIAIYNPNNAKDPLRRNQVNEAQFRQITREIAEDHDQAVGAATEASQNSLATKYNDGAGVWQQVADHDPNDAAWNYPPYVVITA